VINLYSFFLGDIIYEFFDTGLANVLGLETLRHGTNPINYLGIRINGGDPNHGGKASGSTKGYYEDDTRNLFYVFKDSEIKIESIHSGFKRLISLIFQIMGIRTRILARLHCAVSGFNFVAQKFQNIQYPSIITKCCFIFFSYLGLAFSFLISPTIRFRFSKNDLKGFKNDPNYGGMAYCTNKLMGAWRIGLFGSLFTGINFNWFSRIKADFSKAILGSIQIITAIAIAVLSTNIFVANPLLAIPAAVGVLLA